jgi:RNA-binding protein YlmH
LTINEASNRLDAVASGGFGISRNRMMKMIAAEEVMIDWKIITNGATNIKVRF